MKPDRPVGIVGYGAYVPRYRIAAKDISQVWTGGHGGVPVESKSVPGPDEDVITMSLEAARNALKRAAIAPNDLSAVWIGSESHPYSVKPSGTVVAEALGATPFVSSADFEFACKAGTEAMTAGMGMVGSGMARYVLAIGADTAQGRPKIIFLRKLAPGGSVHSFGIHVARMAGMPPSLIERANEVLLQLEQSRNNGENKGDNLDEKLQQLNIPKMQLSIFDAHSATFEEIRTLLNAVDINRLTPVEALLKLQEVKGKVN
jgi:hypothetical protein